MRILISCLVLDRSGTPTYTLTLHNELVRRGHEVVVYSPRGGALAKLMNVQSDLKQIAKPEVIIAQMNVCAIELREAFQQTPLIFSAHGVVPATETPPLFSEVQWYTAINEDVRDNLIAHGVDAGQITIVRDFVNTDRFQPTSQPQPDLKRVLYISNYKKWQTYKVIAQACSRLGVELKAVGAPYGRSRRMEIDINEADLVISGGRGVLEGMACGRPVVSFEQMRGDGYLTPEVYAESRTRNFAGEKCRHTFDAESLADEIRRHYRGCDGVVNLGIALDQHGHVQGVDQMLEVMQEVL